MFRLAPAVVIAPALLLTNKRACTRRRSLDSLISPHHTASLASAINNAKTGINDAIDIANRLTARVFQLLPMRIRIVVTAV
jgi:hypothetical protein